MLQQPAPEPETTANTDAQWQKLRDTLGTYLQERYTQGEDDGAPSLTDICKFLRVNNQLDGLVACLRREQQTPIESHAQAEVAARPVAALLPQLLQNIMLHRISDQVRLVMWRHLLSGQLPSELVLSASSNAVQAISDTDSGISDYAMGAVSATVFKLVAATCWRGYCTKTGDLYAAEHVPDSFVRLTVPITLAHAQSLHSVLRDVLEVSGSIIWPANATAAIRSIMSCALYLWDRTPLYIQRMIQSLFVGFLNAECLLIVVDAIAFSRHIQPAVVDCRAMEQLLVTTSACALLLLEGVDEWSATVSMAFFSSRTRCVPASSLRSRLRERLQTFEQDEGDDGVKAMVSSMPGVIPPHIKRRRRHIEKLRRTVRSVIHWQSYFALVRQHVELRRVADAAAAVRPVERPETPSSVGKNTLRSLTLQFLHAAADLFGHTSDPDINKATALETAKCSALEFQQDLDHAYHMVLGRQSEAAAKIQPPPDQAAFAKLTASQMDKVMNQADQLREARQLKESNSAVPAEPELDTKK
ncbi:hypothetical protein RI367_006887 [Sorochytrium milnesiophthora]